MKYKYFMVLLGAAKAPDACKNQTKNVSYENVLMTLILVLQRKIGKRESGKTNRATDRNWDRNQKWLIEAPIIVKVAFCCVFSLLTKLKLFVESYLTADIQIRFVPTFPWFCGIIGLSDPPRRWQEHIANYIVLWWFLLWCESCFMENGLSNSCFLAIPHFLPLHKQMGSAHKRGGSLVTRGLEPR